MIARVASALFVVGTLVGCAANPSLSASPTAPSPAVAAPPSILSTAATVTPQPIATVIPTASSLPSPSSSPAGYVDPAVAAQLAAKCQIVGDVAYYFVIPPGSTLQTIFPNGGKTPELDGQNDLFVATYDGDVRILNYTGGGTSAPDESPQPLTFQNVVCVVSPTGEVNVYSDVSKQGMALPPGAQAGPLPSAEPTSSAVSPSPPGSPTPSAATTPAPPSYSQAPNAGRWKSLATSETIADQTLAWAPDGKHLVLERSRVNEPAANQFVDVFDSEGNLVQTFQGYDEALWLDNDTIVLSTWSRDCDPTDPSGLCAAEPDKGTSAVAALGSQPQPIGADLVGGLSNGHGAVAFSIGDNMAVWSADGGASKSVPGYPSQWSSDGTRLDIEHPIDGSPFNSWPQIVGWPGLNTIASDESVCYRGGSCTLSQDLTQSATWGWAPGSAKPVPVNPQIVDLDTGKTTPIDLPTPPLGRAAFGKETLLVTTYPGDDATAYGPDGSVSGTWSNVGSMIDVAADGTTFALTDDERWLDRVNVLEGDQVQRLTAPGQLSGGVYSFSLSPDGSELVVVALSGSNQETAYLTNLG